MTVSGRSSSFSSHPVPSLDHWGATAVTPVYSVGGETEHRSVKNTLAIRVPNILYYDILGQSLHRGGFG